MQITCEIAGVFGGENRSHTFPDTCVHLSGQRSQFFSRHRGRVFSNSGFIVKTNGTRSRKPAAITNSRWLAYATAGAASAFTCANSAEATIHYSGLVHEYFGSGCSRSARFQLDQPGDSIRLRHSLEFCGTGSYGGTAHFGVVGRAGNGVAGFYNMCPSAHVASVSNLKRGAFISRRPFLARESGLLAGLRSYCSGGSVGQFDPGDVGFIGFRFDNGSGDQYGWVRVQFVNREPIDHDFWLVDYAYADPGEQSELARRRVMKWFRRKVLSAGSLWELRDY
jgi:hypothetical protein